MSFSIPWSFAVVRLVMFVILYVRKINLIWILPFRAELEHFPKILYLSLTPPNFSKLVVVVCDWISHSFLCSSKISVFGHESCPPKTSFFNWEKVVMHENQILYSLTLLEYAFQQSWSSYGSITIFYSCPLIVGEACPLSLLFTCCLPVLLHNNFVCEYHLVFPFSCSW